MATVTWGTCIVNCWNASLDCSVPVTALLNDDDNIVFNNNNLIVLVS